MPADRVLVIDAGTSALRAVAVAPNGEARDVGVWPWRWRGAADAGSPFAIAMDAAPVIGGLETLLNAAAPQRDSFAAIAFAGQREAIAFLDEANDCVLLSPNIDARAAMEGGAFDAALGARIYDTTGHLPSLLFAVSKFAWLSTHRPTDAARVHTVLPLADWLASLVTGHRAISRNLACEIGLLDVTTCEPARTLTEQLVGMEAAAALHRAPIVDACETVALSTATGLDGIPVIHAGADTQCAALGAGATHPGDAACVGGWSAPVQLVLDQPLLDAKRRTWTGLHVLHGKWMLESNAGDTGRAWEWVCGMLGVTPAEADALAAQSPPGAHDGLMVLGRAPMNAARMTAGVGAITFPLPLAMWSLDHADLLRATLEAAAYAMRVNVEQLEEVSGRRIERLKLAGGMSRGALFAQTIADVLDRPIEVARSPETTAVGAAALAFVATGTFASIDEAVAAMTEPRTVAMPDLRTSATYDDCYARWRMLAQHMEQAP